MIFHRIKDNFMIQAGKSYPDGSQEVSPYGNIEFEGDGSHVDGAISMASTGAGVGGSAEFFICDGAQSGLDGDYAAFGLVIEGMGVVQAIAAVEHDNSLEPTPENPYLPGGGKPLIDIIINSIIIENQ
jgi:peptidyl-prolyl cis-trans isomerase B (cyclophilin B)